MGCQGELHGRADAVVHHVLPVAVVGKAAMGTVVRVGPGLVVAISGIGIGLPLLRVADKVGKVGLEGGGESRLLAHLLEGDELPRLVGDDAFKRGARPV